jgi:hypothetical protein
MKSMQPARTLAVGICALITLLAAAAILDRAWPPASALAAEKTPPLTLEQIPFDGRAAYEYLKQICAVGPRPSGSAGMVAQQKVVSEHFQRLGAQVHFQEFRASNPLDQSSVPMANMIIEWYPDRTERILLCTHYDTRPLPDHDPHNVNGVHIGANDGASGLAVLMELGKWMPRLESKYGVDFVLFDGSRFVFKDGKWGKKGDPYFLGAEHFAKAYVSDPPPYKYRWGLMLNMVGSQDLQVYEEMNSMSYRATRPLVEDIWRAAYHTGVRDFVATRKDTVSDDHIRLNEIAKIPTCEIVDFDDPTWRTQQDIPQHCSPLSLAKVGWVVLQWLPQAK